MNLDFSKILTGSGGLTEPPVLRLQTLSGKNLGAITYAHDIKFNIVYTGDVSTIEFEVPYMVNGRVNDIYDKIVGLKVVYTDNLGVYLITSPTVSGDGVNEYKKVEGSSIEKLFERKSLFMEEGTYNFWNPTNPSDTILGRIIETDPSWSVGYVASRLIDCYRTFDQIDDYVLTFCYGDAMEKYRCSFVFDPYERTINVYDANENQGTLPIYLDYKNLIESVEVEEITEDVITKLHVYGADDLSIREVNPLGTDYVVDLSYFIENGDLDIVLDDSGEKLSDKVVRWEKALLSRQQHYSGLIALRASKTAEQLASTVELTELNGELEALYSKQSVTIQAIALESTTEGKAAQQAVLDSINEDISEKKAEISDKESDIEDIEESLSDYLADIQEINEELSISTFFNEAEYAALNRYLIEGDLVEETFVATDIDTSASGTLSSVSGNLKIKNSSIQKVSSTGGQSDIYTITGGTIVVDESSLAATIIRGTLEHGEGSGEYILTCYLGTTLYAENEYPSGLITLSGTVSSLSSDIEEIVNDEVTEFTGSFVTIKTIESKTYFTVNVSDYQKYSVAKELFDFGADAIADAAYPTYEFSINSANFLFLDKFAPFKNALTLGKGVHLNLGSMGHITPNIIGVEIDFGDLSSFTMTFSNQFQLKNGVESLSDMINGAYSSTRSFDSSKYIYNKAADQASIVSKYMSNTLDAAVQTILGSSNQSVIINGAGIQVGEEDSKYKLRIVDNMIAMTDDDWETAKLAIGRFASEDVGEVWGVNAELVAGKLLIGNSLILENPLYDGENNPTGTMQFKVDSTGAWLYNSRIVLQTDSVATVDTTDEDDAEATINAGGGVMILDPAYGIVAGNGSLFGTNGTTITPNFLDEYGVIKPDEDGMPKNANFYLDIRDGNAYIRGTLYGTAGKIGGWTLDEDFMYTGSAGNYVALNGSGENGNSLYALWAGAESPDDAPFWVKKDGSISASNGTFSGTLSAAKVSGALMSADEGGWLAGCGIAVGQSGKDSEYTSDNYNFFVDAKGNVTIKNGSISFDSLDSDAQSQIANAISASEDVHKLSVGKYYPSIAAGSSETTFISGTKIYSPSISGGEVYGGKFYATGLGRDDGAAYYIYKDSEITKEANRVGYISYDTGGAGTSAEARNRVFFTTENSTALKIQSAAGLSLSGAGGVAGGVYILSDAYFSYGIYTEGYISPKGGLIGGEKMYGTALPTTGMTTGQVFFKLAT